MLFCVFLSPPRRPGMFNTEDGRGLDREGTPLDCAWDGRESRLARSEVEENIDLDESGVLLALEEAAMMDLTKTC